MSSSCLLKATPSFLIKVIILYNSNDREIKQLDKKQLKEAEAAENLEEIIENNSLEPKEFKRVALGGERGIRTPERFHVFSFQD